MIRFLVVFFCTAVFGQVTNDYVSLYEVRVEIARHQLAETNAEALFQTSRRERFERMASSTAVPAEDVERAQADHAIAIARRDGAQATLAENQHMLGIVRQLIEKGQSVPLCR